MSLPLFTILHSELVSGPKGYRKGSYGSAVQGRYFHLRLTRKLVATSSSLHRAFRTII